MSIVTLSIDEGARCLTDGEVFGVLLFGLGIAVLSWLLALHGYNKYRELRGGY